MALTVINKDNFESTIHSGKLVLVDFFATWCGPCKALAPVLEEVQAEVNAEEIEIVKVDIDQDRALAMKFAVMSVPTMIIFKDGKAIVKMMGLQPKEEIYRFIDEAKKRI